MPSGKTHDRVNLVSTAIMGVAGYYYGFDIFHILAFCLGSVVATLWFSPDLDLKYSRPVKRWGKLSFIWWPYSLLIPHRGISHIPIIGIITRFGYIFLIFSLLWFIITGTLYNMGLSPPTLKPSILFKNPYILPFLLGVLFADTLHIVLDWSWTSLKRQMRSRRKR